MVLIYAGVARQAAVRARPFPATGWFFAGYISIWLVFAAAATLAQYGLERAALLTPMFSFSSSFVGGAVLIAAGLYQWTPIKGSCLSQCQAPLLFIRRHGGFRSDAAGALSLGAKHGTYCLGCCWMLMALLFVAGVMNLVWVMILTLVVLIEKILPWGRLLARAIGTMFIAAGVWLIAAQM
jgi:predicted metal-binding membrane protein